MSNVWQLFGVEIALALVALVVLVADILLPSERRSAVGPLAAGLTAAVFVLSFLGEPEGQFAGVFVVNAATLFFQRLFLAAAVVGILGGMGHVAQQNRWRQGEYYFLLLSSVLGMLILPGARDLILLIISFELMGLPLYVLAAFEKGDAANDGHGLRSSEAGIKLFLVGSGSTAVTLFGLSLLAGLSGGTSFAALSAAPHSPLLALGAMFVLAGIGFKLGVAPLHMWVPDTYEGSSGHFVAFLAASPKAAAVAALCTVFGTSLSGMKDNWTPVMGALGLLSIAVGSFLALPQKNVRRLLAYSGIAHVGYMLLAFAAGSADGMAMVLFYGVSYVATNAGILLVAHAVATDSGNDTIGGLSGLARRSPWLAAALLVFVLSLAGIPFVAGFWAKLYVFLSAWQAGLHTLVILGALLSVVALFFYLRLARAAYFDEPAQAAPVQVGRSLRFAIIACLIAVVGIGAAPGPLVDAAARAASSFLTTPSPVAMARTLSHEEH